MSDAEAVASAFAAAASAWPDVPLAREVFAEAVRDLGADDLAKLRAPDLYLALACAQAEPAALAVFDRDLVGVIERAVTVAGATPAETAELVQIVRVRLLVAKAPDAAPAIAGFSGRSSLASWVKVVATREAARLLAHDRREEPSDDLAIADRAAETDPRLEHLKRTYREEFRAAFAAAVDALTDRERLLLRQHVLDGLGIDQLAPLYNVHRATAARWVAAAQRAVIEKTHRALRDRLRIPHDELESILRLIGSQLDISLPLALREAGKR
jgi:RNA polymerase sigma-70 factor (ECF subfamily)